MCVFARPITGQTAVANQVAMCKCLMAGECRKISWQQLEAACVQDDYSSTFDKNGNTMEYLNLVNLNLNQT